MNSLYLHIPFCRKKCIYCDFYSIEYRSDIASSYIDILCKQINKLDSDFSTIYIGGGTPTVLEISLWKKLFRSLARFYRSRVEFTIEANPESLCRDKIKLFLDEGVNRISIGVQSLYEDKLQKLTRIHSAQEGEEKVLLAKREGFKNINIDLIFGVWDEELSSWRKELRKVVSMPITHISAYSLTVEEKTPLFKKLKEGNLPPLNEEVIAQMYEFNLDYLPWKGFLQYEVSNFSKRGYQCQHNLNYWHNNSYVGLGPSAVSYLEGVRKKNVSDCGEYIKRAKRNEVPFDYQEKLKPLQKAKETAAVKIRCKEGIDFQEFKSKTGYDFLRVARNDIKDFIKQGILRYKKKRGKIKGLCLTKKGFLFSDTVSSAFL
jgi:oxygen-independent coproporphyrinogen-3 oxidase